MSNKLTRDIMKSNQRETWQINYLDPESIRQETRKEIGKWLRSRWSGEGHYIINREDIESLEKGEPPR